MVFSTPTAAISSSTGMHTTSVLNQPTTEDKGSVSVSSAVEESSTITSTHMYSSALTQRHITLSDSSVASKSTTKVPTTVTNSTAASFTTNINIDGTTTTLSTTAPDTFTKSTVGGTSLFSAMKRSTSEAWRSSATNQSWENTTVPATGSGATKAQENGKKKAYLTWLIVILVFVLLIIGVGIFIIWRKKRKIKWGSSLNKSAGKTEESISEGFDSTGTEILNTVEEANVVGDATTNKQADDLSVHNPEQTEPDEVQPSDANAELATTAKSQEFDETTVDGDLSYRWTDTITTQLAQTAMERFPTTSEQAAPSAVQIRNANTVAKSGFATANFSDSPADPSLSVYSTQERTGSLSLSPLTVSLPTDMTSKNA